jgi:Domain of unknown function (DUF4389)
VSQPPDPAPSEPERDPGEQPPAAGAPPLPGQAAPPDQPRAGQPTDLAPPPGYWLPPGYGPSGSGRAPAAELAPILVSFPPAVRQRRLTIAFRLILAIPHLVVLWALTLAAEVVGIIGWFAALFTGQLPEWAHTFMTGVLRWQARAYSYLLFLTDSYPPFSLEDEPYPVRLLTMRTRVRRLAVLFRVLLLFPAAVVLGLAYYGMVVLSFFCWLVALVGGRLPAPLHQAIASVVRFALRYYGYTFVLTSEYPWTGLLGDVEPVSTLRGISTSADTVTSEADSGSATAALVPGDPWRLQLSGGARALVAVLLTVGAVALVGATIGSASESSSPVSAFSNARGLFRVEQAYTQLAGSVTSFESAAEACTKLSCLTAQDRKVGAALGTFAAAVRSAGLSGRPGADAQRLANDATGARASLAQLARATTVSEYESANASLPLARQLNDLDTEYNKLVQDLGS